MWFNDFWAPVVIIAPFFKQIKKRILLVKLYSTSCLLWYHFIMVVQEDPVLLVPEDEKQKPYVAIIKVIDLLT